MTIRPAAAHRPPRSGACAKKPQASEKETSPVLPVPVRFSPLLSVRPASVVLTRSFAPSIIPRVLHQRLSRISRCEPLQPFSAGGEDAPATWPPCRIRPRHSTCTESTTDHPPPLLPVRSASDGCWEKSLGSSPVLCCPRSFLFSPRALLSVPRFHSSGWCDHFPGNIILSFSRRTPLHVSLTGTKQERKKKKKKKKSFQLATSSINYFTQASKGQLTIKK